jgi:hypothetical protein
MPDVIGVRRDGVVDMFEVQSDSDVGDLLATRLENAMQTLPESLRGLMQVVPPTPPTS